MDDLLIPLSEILRFRLRGALKIWKWDQEAKKWIDPIEADDFRYLN